MTHSFREDHPHPTTPPEIPSRSDASECTTGSEAGNRDTRFLSQLRLFFEVKEDNGALFFEAEYQATYHQLPRSGVVALEQSLIDLLNAQASLGRQGTGSHAAPSPD